MVRDGKQNAFMREFGRMAFDHAVRDADYAQVFDNAMSSYSSAQAEWVLNALAAYDFSKMTHLCDVGGGHGYMLARLLARYPHLEGTVLERAEVISDSTRLWAGKLGVSDRCRYVAGDMFKTAPRADAYIMKLILHDWKTMSACGFFKTSSRRQLRAAEYSSSSTSFLTRRRLTSPNCLTSI